MEKFIRDCERICGITDWTSEQPEDLHKIADRLKAILFPISHSVADVITLWERVEVPKK